MSFSYNMFPVREIKLLHGGIEHFESLPLLGAESIDYNEEGSKYPKLNELTQVLSTKEMSIKEELIREQENDVVSKSFLVFDPEFEVPNDITVIYPNNNSDNPQISSMFGVKSEMNFMIKLASRLSDEFGSMALSSPYEVIHVSKHLSYKQNIELIGSRKHP